MTHEFKQGYAVSIALPDGTIDGGWKIFVIDEASGTAIVTKEVGTEIESKKVQIADLR